MLARPISAVAGQRESQADIQPLRHPRQAKSLARRSLYDVTVISPTGYFAFTPLLASTSVGTLEYRVALESVRRLPGVQLILGRARDIDIKKNQITIASGVPNPAKSQWSTSAPPRALGSPFRDEAKGRESEGAAEEELFALEYDKLVVAVGAFSATFGTPGVRFSALMDRTPRERADVDPFSLSQVYEHAHFLKDIRDARAIRKRILDCFERASEPFVREKEKRELVSFRIVGGGPTVRRASERSARLGCLSLTPLFLPPASQGVEFAAELHDLISSDMKKHYPDLAKMASITLYDVAPGILLSFEESLQRYAMNTFARDQVIVRPNSKVNRVGDGWMEIEGEGKVPFGLLVWSTGLEANPLIKSMKGVSKDDRSLSCVLARLPEASLRLVSDRALAPSHHPGFTPTTSSASLATRAGRSTTSLPSATTPSSRTATGCRRRPRSPRKRRPSSPRT